MNIEKYLIDYDKLEVGDKLWSIQLGDCTMRGIGLNAQLGRIIICANAEGLEVYYTEEGFHSKKDAFPSLLTSNPFADISQPIISNNPISVHFGKCGTDPEGIADNSESILQEAGKSLRYNQGKTDWSFISFEALKPLVEVLEFGARKYARDNWKLPTDPEIPLQSMLRHVIELAEGHTIDRESGAPTIGHIMANAMFYAYHTIVTEKGGLK